DEPRDIIHMIRLANTNRYDIIVGNRFKKESKISGYPTLKLLANRIFNILLAVMFNTPYKDLSNAFKMYRRSFIKTITIEAVDFDITVELPVKAWIAGKRFIEMPNNWYGRKAGSPKWKLAKAGRVYLNRLWLLYKLQKKTRARARE
nr:glycosyltransferase family 2 protein [Candidatus Sigynarchaeota archaeon]